MISYYSDILLLTFWILRLLLNVDTCCHSQNSNLIINIDRTKIQISMSNRDHHQDRQQQPEEVAEEVDTSDLGLGKTAGKVTISTTTENINYKNQEEKEIPKDQTTTTSSTLTTQHTSPSSSPLPSHTSHLSTDKGLHNHDTLKNIVSRCLEESTIKLEKMRACQAALQTISTKLSVQESNLSSFTAALDANMNRSSSKLQEFNVIDAVQSKRSVDNQKNTDKCKR